MIVISVAALQYHHSRGWAAAISKAVHNWVAMSSSKMEVDYSSTVETAIPQAKEISKQVCNYALTSNEILAAALYSRYRICITLETELNCGESRHWSLNFDRWRIQTAQRIITRFRSISSILCDHSAWHSILTFFTHLGQPRKGYREPVSAWKANQNCASPSYHFLCSLLHLMRLFLTLLLFI